MGSTSQKKWVSVQSIQRTSEGERPHWGGSYNDSPTIGAFVHVIAEDVNAIARC